MGWKEWSFEKKTGLIFGTATFLLSFTFWPPLVYNNSLGILEAIRILLMIPFWIGGGFLGDAFESKPCIPDFTSCDHFFLASLFGSLIVFLVFFCIGVLLGAIIGWVYKKVKPRNQQTNPN